MQGRRAQTEVYLMKTDTRRWAQTEIYLMKTETGRRAQTEVYLMKSKVSVDPGPCFLVLVFQSHNIQRVQSVHDCRPFQTVAEYDGGVVFVHGVELVVSPGICYVAVPGVFHHLRVSILKFDQLKSVQEKRKEERMNERMVY